MKNLILWERYWNQYFIVSHGHPESSLWLETILQVIMELRSLRSSFNTASSDYTQSTIQLRFSRLTCLPRPAQRLELNCKSHQDAWGYYTGAAGNTLLQWRLSAHTFYLMVNSGVALQLGSREYLNLSHQCILKH